MTISAEGCDVLVLGGGPAGSSLAAVLAENGWHVEVWEKDPHPRFHIGESLLPLTLPYLQQLGVLEEVERIGLQKFGAELVSPVHDEPITLYFSGAMDKTHPYAFQVRRSEFDNILLQNCQRKGAQIHEGFEAKTVDFSDPRLAIVYGKNAQGISISRQARFVVDATGRQAFLANQFQAKQRNRHHNSASVFGHFEGVVRHADKDEGNLTICWFDHGWFWIIPLPDGPTSVGMVCWPPYLKSRTNTLEDFFWQTVQSSPHMAHRMKQAKAVMPIVATGNYSYQSTIMTGQNFILVGDAFAFVDPILSSGVHLALHSGIRGADVVEAFLQGHPEAEQKARDFEAAVKHGLKMYSWFIFRITQPAFRNLAMAPKNYFRMHEAISSVLSGDIFGSTPVKFPLIIFKGVYYLTALLDLKANLGQYRRRKHAVEGEPLSS
ncbi:MAG: tryptophan 7-halogenase [Nitrospirota bacterium]|nr:tryptophan 7-halogenase [Nitrospirota bacterium]MDH5586989.1 tryptophan 7-halogenase [Nitrospirota bacterium]MDH5773301.1 tryptophan 7-halogenase [Nitrospirota bacterium]